jgi:hypothetical protein
MFTLDVTILTLAAVLTAIAVFSTKNISTAIAALAFMVATVAFLAGHIGAQRARRTEWLLERIAIDLHRIARQIAPADDHTGQASTAPASDHAPAALHDRGLAAEHDLADGVALAQAGRSKVDDSTSRQTESEPAPSDA